MSNPVEVEEIKMIEDVIKDELNRLYIQRMKTTVTEEDNQSSKMTTDDTTTEISNYFGFRCD